MSNPCPLCQSVTTEAFLHRRNVPVHVNLVMPDAAAAQAVPRGDLELRCCYECGFVFNARFDPHLLNYGGAYDNTQTCSPTFGAHAEQMAQRLVYRHGLRGKRLVEVGCGQGQFLRRLLELDDGNVGMGFDPSYTGEAESMEGRMRVRRQCFDNSCPAAMADVVICRHVIEHVADPRTMLRLMRQALTAGGQLFMELRCAQWVLQRQVFWDVYYEQCSYFTDGSLDAALSRAGFHVDLTDHVFEGQYLWIQATQCDDSAEALPHARSVPHLAAVMSWREEDLIRSWQSRVQEMATQGQVILWGAAAKGATFANLIDPRGEEIAAVVDINPNKQSRFLPGTGHPIISPESLGAQAARRGRLAAVLVTNPNYHHEIRLKLEGQGIQAPVIDILETGNQP